MKFKKKMYKINTILGSSFIKFKRHKMTIRLL